MEIAELPDSFFQLTPDELKRAMESAAQERTQLIDRPLMTESMRQAAALERQAKYPKVIFFSFIRMFDETVIRLKFGDRIQVQSTFKSDETVEDLYTWVRSILNDVSISFYLCN